MVTAGVTPVDAVVLVAAGAAARVVAVVASAHASAMSVRRMECLTIVPPVKVVSVTVPIGGK